jgi:polysaccharide export outer membrane protein
LDVVIDENGEISLPLIDRVKVAGLTASELAERIQASYVPRYYVRCNATVLATTRFFYVGGEVRAPGRYGWSEDVTLLKAINTSGGFTDYANRKKVEVIRGKQRIVVDCEVARSQPAKDVSILPGDSIWVGRSIF